MVNYTRNKCNGLNPMDFQDNFCCLMIRHAMPLWSNCLAFNIMGSVNCETNQVSYEMTSKLLESIFFHPTSIDDAFL